MMNGRASGFSILEGAPLRHKRERTILMKSTQKFKGLFDCHLVAGAGGFAENLSQMTCYYIYPDNWISYNANSGA